LVPSLTPPHTPLETPRDLKSSLTPTVLSPAGVPGDLLFLEYAVLPLLVLIPWGSPALFFFAFPPRISQTPVISKDVPLRSPPPPSPQHIQLTSITTFSPKTFGLYGKTSPWAPSIVSLSIRSEDLLRWNFPPRCLPEALHLCLHLFWRTSLQGSNNSFLLASFHLQHSACSQYGLSPGTSSKGLSCFFPLFPPLPELP